MTDNEIIKALEYCQSETTENCNKCPLVFKGACQQECLRKAFDLINRQQADLEFAKNINALQMEELMKAQAEIERLEKENTILSRNADTAFQDGLNEAQELYAEEIKSRVKTEAIKEFAERLKAKFADIEYVIKTHRKTLPVERVKAEVDAVLQNGCSNIIDKVLKEMEDEDK